MDLHTLPALLAILLVLGVSVDPTHAAILRRRNMQDNSRDNWANTTELFSTQSTTTSSPFILSSDLLYPYGSAIDTVSPREDDGGSPMLFSSREIPLFGSNYSYLYVNNNGLLSFISPIGDFIPQVLPVTSENPFLAVFWSDVDNRLVGDIYYRESTDPDLLSRATSDINTYFHDVNFTAQWAFVATWHQVTHHSSTTNKVNTFQAVLSTNGNQTFLLYNYEDIQWPSNIDVNRDEPLALAGVNSGYNTGFYTLPGSLSLAIGNLADTSNVNVTGRWALKMDKLHPEDADGNIYNSTVITTTPPNITDRPTTTTSGRPSVTTTSTASTRTTSTGQSTVSSSQTSQTTSSASKLSIASTAELFTCLIAFVLFF